MVFVYVPMFNVVERNYTIALLANEQRQVRFRQAFHEKFKYDELRHTLLGPEWEYVLR